MWSERWQQIWKQYALFRCSFSLWSARVLLPANVNVSLRTHTRNSRIRCNVHNYCWNGWASVLSLFARSLSVCCGHWHTFVCTHQYAPPKQHSHHRCVSPFLAFSSTLSLFHSLCVCMCRYVAVLNVVVCFFLLWFCWQLILSMRWKRDNRVKTVLSKKRTKTPHENQEISSISPKWFQELIRKFSRNIVKILFFLYESWWQISCIAQSGRKKWK